MYLKLKKFLESKIYFYNLEDVPQSVKTQGQECNTSTYITFNIIYNDIDISLSKKVKNR